MDRKTREMSLYEKKPSKKLVEFLPPVYRQCAVCYTDLELMLVFFRRVIKKRKSGPHNERFSLRQRISRLVRKTLSFQEKSKCHLVFYPSL